MYVYIQGLDKIMESMVKEQNGYLIWCWTAFGTLLGIDKYKSWVVDHGI